MSLESDSVPPEAEAKTDPAPKPTDSDKIDQILEMVVGLTDHVLRLDANVQIIKGKQEAFSFDAELINRKLGILQPDTSVAASLLQLQTAVHALSRDLAQHRGNTEEESSHTRESIRALEQAVEAEEKRAVGANGR